MADKPRITAEELSRKLVGSRKLISKVETGDYETGNINTDVLFADPEKLMGEGIAPISNPARPAAPLNEDKIMQSRLPDAIKKAMIETPIEQITLGDSLDMKFVENTRKLMEQEGVSTRKKVQPFSQGKKQVQESTGSIPNSAELERRLTPIIENIIRKTMDDIVNEKITQLLSIQNAVTLNENLAIKVGNTIFTGKITKSKSAK